MKKVLYIILFFYFNAITIGAKFKPAYPFSIYKGKVYNESLSYKPSAWDGDFSLLELDTNCTNNPKSNKYCMKFTYYPRRKPVFHWVGVYWTFPAHNWGNIDGGFNLSGAKEFSFWIKSKQGTGAVAVQIGGTYGRYSDTECIAIGIIKFDKKWRKITIPIKKQYDMSHIGRGFAIMIRATDYMDIRKKLKVDEKIILYIDEIEYR